MPQLLSDAMPKARKEHRCITCNITIKVGEVYSRENYVYEGMVYTWKTCSDCALLTNDVYSWCADPYEGVGHEQYFEWALENSELPEATAYLERVQYEYPED